MRERNPRRDEWPDSFLRRSSKNMRIDLRLRTTAELFSPRHRDTREFKDRPIKSAEIAVVADRVETRQKAESKVHLIMWCRHTLF